MEVARDVRVLTVGVTELGNRLGETRRRPECRPVVRDWGLIHAPPACLLDQHRGCGQRDLPVGGPGLSQVAKDFAVQAGIAHLADEAEGQAGELPVRLQLVSARLKLLPRAGQVVGGFGVHSGGA